MSRALYPIRAVVLAFLSLGLLSGCATKRDLRDLRDEIVAMQVRQDSMLNTIQRQNRQMLDSVRATNESMVRMRGDLANRLVELDRQLVQLAELTGQSTQRIAEIRQRLEGPAASSPAPSASGPAAVDEETGNQLYEVGVEQLQQGAAATARRAFEQLLRDSPNHPRAADAQYQLGEAYLGEGQDDRALREWERVVELFPNSPRAPQALLRAGMLAEERGNNRKAREYLQRVVAGYPNSDEARAARDRLRRLQ